MFCLGALKEKGDACLPAGVPLFSVEDGISNGTEPATMIVLRWLTASYAISPLTVNMTYAIMRDDEISSILLAERLPDNDLHMVMLTGFSSDVARELLVSFLNSLLLSFQAFPSWFRQETGRCLREEGTASLT